MDIGPITLSNTTATPANSKIVPVLDSTYWNYEAPWTSASAVPAPGKSRGQLAGARVTGSALSVTQNSTLKFYLLTNPSGTTNGAWEIDTNAPGGGTVTLVAGTTYPFSWLPVTPDYMITVTAGATAPDAVRTAINLVWDRTSGA